MDGKDLDRARKLCLSALRRADRIGIEGLSLGDLFGYLSTRRFFQKFEVWGMRRILAVLRAARDVDQSMVEAVIAALECLAAEGMVLIGDSNGESILFLTEKGRTPENL